MTMLAVFRSRTQAVAFVSALRENGVSAQAVYTPREANVGCGISVKFEDGDFFRVRLALQKGRYSSFSGFMKRTRSGGYAYADH